MSNNNLKIIILVLSFIIVGLAGNTLILNDIKANPVIAPVEISSELPEKAELPELTQEPETLQATEEPQLPEIEQLPQVQEPMADKEADRYFLKMNKYADENGFVVDEGVLVKYIGDNSTVTIPDNVLIIGEGAFEDCFMLENVTIPGNVMVIDDRAFYNCNKLAYITHSSEILYVGENAFYATPWFDNLNQEYNIIGDGVLIKYVMQNSNDISLPNSIKSIASYAFMDCTSLQSVTFPSSVISVGANAFATCWSLSDVNLNTSLLHVGDYAFNDTPWFYDLDDEFVVLGDGALVKFNSYENTVVVPNNVRNISAGVFENFKDITSLTVPNTVDYIGERAFAGCISLEHLNLPSSVASIGDDAFEQTIWFENLSDEFCIVGDCILVKYNGNNATVVIPDGVKSVVKDTFTQAISMISLTIPDSVTDFDINALNYHLYMQDIFCNDEYVLIEIVDNYRLDNAITMDKALELAHMTYEANRFTGRMNFKIYTLSKERGSKNIYVMAELEKGQEEHEWKPSLAQGYDLAITDGKGFFYQIIK